jgi:hypothetical protein
MGLLYDEQKYLKQSAWSLSLSLPRSIAQISFGVVAENNCFFLRETIYLFNSI